MLIILLYGFFAIALFSSIIRNIVAVSAGSGIWLTDVINLVIVLTLTMKVVTQKKIFVNLLQNYLGKKLLIIILILIIPLFIGLLLNNSMITILRDARMLPLYVVPFSFVIVLNNEKRWETYIKFVVMMILMTLTLFFLALILNFRTPQMYGIDVPYVTSSGIIYRYGITSANFFFPFLFFFVFNQLFSGSYNRRYTILLIILSLASMFAIAYFAMRSLILGFCLGIIINVIILGKKKKVISFASFFIFLLLFLFTFVPSKSLLKIPQLERIYSLVDPKASTTGVEANLEVRLEAIDLARIELEYPFVGNGYGDPKLYVKRVRSNLARWWNHSSIGWAIYKLGYLLSLVYFILYILIIKCGVKLYKVCKNDYIKASLLGIVMYLICVMVLSGGTNSLFRGDFLTMSTVMCIGLLMSASNLYKKKSDKSIK